MNTLIGCVALVLAVAVSPADAKGCLKGAAVGGAAGHFAGHHGLLGAAAGCVIGRHEANKREREPLRDRDQPTTTGQSVQYR
jgi:hypothetical protein